MPRPQPEPTKPGGVPAGTEHKLYIASDKTPAAEKKALAAAIDKAVAAKQKKASA